MLTLSLNPRLPLKIGILKRKVADEHHLQNKWC